MCIRMLPSVTLPGRSSLILVHMQHRKRLSLAFDFKHVDKFPLQETESPPSGPVWTDSPPGTPFLSCAVKSSARATHPVDCTVLHKHVPVCLPSQPHSCAIYSVTAVTNGFQLNTPCIRTAVLLLRSQANSVRGGKARLGREADHLPHIVLRSRISRSCNSSSTKHRRGVQRNMFTFYYCCYADVGRKLC
jgi:hypothetical protein